MQVTDAMVAAAMKAFRLQPADLNVPDPEGMYIDHRRMRDAIQAAIDALPERDDFEPPPFVTALTEETLAALPADVAEAVRKLLHSRTVWRNLGHWQGTELEQLRAERDAMGHDLRVPVRIHVQVDEPAFKASVAAAVEALPGVLPRDEQGRVTIATLTDELAPRTGGRVSPGTWHPLSDGRKWRVAPGAPGETGLVVDTPAALGSFTAPLDGIVPVLVLLNPDEVATHLGVSFTQVDEWIGHIDDGRFPQPHKWVSGTPLWQVGVIDQWYAAWKASNGG